jgi:hypothetical protein
MPADFRLHAPARSSPLSGGEFVLYWIQTTHRTHDTFAFRCIGKFDRPLYRRPVFGTVRSMSLRAAEKKFAAAAFIRAASK